jgi:predicted nuclease of predicted toxin-antitoxin system
MNLLADEGLERVVVERLRRDGHSVGWVAELAPSVPDEEVLRLAIAGGAVLVTEDKDFGELVYRRRLGHTGVVLVRLEGLPNALKAEIVSEAMRAYGQEMAGAFSVVSPDSVRVRRPSGDPEPAAV